MKNLNLTQTLQDHLDKKGSFDQTLTICFSPEGAEEIRAAIKNQNDFTSKQLIKNVQTIDSYLIDKIKEDKEICYPWDFMEAFYDKKIKNKLTEVTKQKFYIAMNVIKSGRVAEGDGLENILKYYDRLYNKNFTVALLFLIDLIKAYDLYKENNFKLDWEDIKHKSLSSEVVFPPKVLLMVNQAQYYSPLEWLVINKLISVSQSIHLAASKI